MSKWDRIREAILALAEERRFRREGWTENPDEEDFSYWSRFESDFGFRYGTTAEMWPGIRESTPSRTWRVSGLLALYSADRARFDERELQLKRAVLRVLKDLLGPSEQMLFLDLNHVGYSFTPAQLEDPVSNYQWPRSIIPWDGYRLLISTDFRHGLFGHPFEQTLCAFGGLADRLVTRLPPEIGPLLRVNGTPALNPAS